MVFLIPNFIKTFWRYQSHKVATRLWFPPQIYPKRKKNILIRKTQNAENLCISPYISIVNENVTPIVSKTTYIQALYLRLILHCHPHLHLGIPWNIAMAHPGISYWICVHRGLYDWRNVLRWKLFNFCWLYSCRVNDNGIRTFINNDEEGHSNTAMSPGLNGIVKCGNKQAMS